MVSAETTLVVLLYICPPAQTHAALLVLMKMTLVIAPYVYLGNQECAAISVATKTTPVVTPYGRRGKLARAVVRVSTKNILAVSSCVSRRKQASTPREDNASIGIARLPPARGTLGDPGPHGNDTRRTLARAKSMAIPFDASTTPRSASQGVKVVLMCGYRNLGPRDRYGRSTRGPHAKLVRMSRSALWNEDA